MMEFDRLLQEDTTKLFQIIQLSSQQMQTRLLDRICVQQHSIVLGEMSLDLQFKPMVLRLFQAFLDLPYTAKSREQLIESVYVKPLPLSQRQQLCYEHNVVKLVSRARRLASESLPTHDYLHLDWFPYDHEKHLWTLFRIRELTCVADQLTAFEIGPEGASISCSSKSIARTSLNS